MDRLTVFGLVAVSAMLVCYALEHRSHWYILAFAVSCVMGSTYGFLQGAWPFGLVEAVWSVVACRRWKLARISAAAPALLAAAGRSRVPRTRHTRVLPRAKT
jgi:hypothetical protein